MILFATATLIVLPSDLLAAKGYGIPSIGPVRAELVIFGLILAGVALFHRYTFQTSLTGVMLLLLFNLIFDPEFHLGEHLIGDVPFIDQLIDKELRSGEWGILLNLAGFAVFFLLLGWNPSDNREHKIVNCPVKNCIWNPENHNKSVYLPVQDVKPE
ncbi:MAG: hypothetical protein JW861_13770 [Bacteroidales bacterium]|nr:hypothetical protein [Bacteroidales bacterium]